MPRSVSAVSWLSLLPGPWRSSTFWATTSPLKFCHGPLPIRSRALITLTEAFGDELEVGAPDLVAGAGRHPEALAAGVRRIHAAEVAALAGPVAGDEERHVG